MNGFFEVSQLEKFLQSHPDSVLFALLAYQKLQAGEVDRALALCEEGVKQHPDYDFGHFVLGLCWLEKKNFHQAKTHLELATAYNEHNPRAWKLLGEINARLNLPVVARNASVRYFVHDMFNPDAEERVQQASLLSLGILEEEIEKEAPGETPEEEQLFREEEFETLFQESEETPAEKKEQPADEEVEEVLRETLGDLSSLDEGESAERGETLDIEALKEQEGEKLEGEQEFSTALDYFFSEIEGEEQKKAGEEKVESAAPPEPEEAQSSQAPESEPLQATEDDFWAALEKEESGEEEKPVEMKGPSPAETRKSETPVEQSEEKPTPPSGEEEELLDFSSVVENIISERKEELTEKEEDQESGATSVTIIREEEAESEEPEQAPETPTEARKEQEGESFAQFGKPPIVSPTLGEIYIAQGRFDEALEIFEKLLEQEPDNPKYQKKIEFIRNLQRSQQSDQGEES